MQAELRGSLPKLPYAYSKTLVNRAWRKVRESHLWSFNLFVSNWITPPALTGGQGTVTVVQGSPSITFDATAVTAINALVAANPYAPATVFQFRIGVGDIYSIIAYNNVTGAATLDRMWADPGGASLTFQLYQLYYPAPYKDFLGWLTVRNMQMFIDMDLTKNRQWVDATDPQRTWYQFPTKVIPYGIDTRGQGTANASATLGYPLFELWGQPVAPFTYACYGMRRGTDLVNPTDTLPAGIGEDLVTALARVYAYEWALANMDIVPRSQGPDWRFLIGQAQAVYNALLVQYRRQDKEFCNNYFSQFGMPMGVGIGIYNTISGIASPYAPY